MRSQVMWCIGVNIVTALFSIGVLYLLPAATAWNLISFRIEEVTFIPGHLRKYGVSPSANNSATFLDAP
jgi:hypothetical protein